MNATTRSTPATATAAVQQFHVLSDDALVNLQDTGAICGGRSRASLYRDHKAGRLPFVKVGSTTRVRVGDIRKLIGAE
jgi:hypothetical protein